MNASNRMALVDERAQHLNAIDDIIRSAQEQHRQLTPAEQADHDYAARRCDELERQIDRMSPLTRPTIDRTISPNRAADARVAERSLDELLWATAPEVSAGSISDQGVFRPDPAGARVQIEQVIVRSNDQGAGYLAAPRINEFAPQDQEAVRAFQQTVADMIVFGLMVDKSAKSSGDGFEVARSHRLMVDRWRHVCRAMDVDTSGEGTDWVPTGIGATMHEKVRAAGKIAPLFQRIDLPTNPWKWPIEGGDATAYRVAEPTSDTASKVTASTPGTLGVTFDAEILGGRILFSRSVEADSAVAILPFTQGKLIRAFMTAEERAILDGDTDGTHMDSDVQALGVTDARTAWDGLRKKGLAQTATNTNAALSVTKVRDLRATMGKWGLNPADLAIIVGVNSYYDLLEDDNLLTLDKLGPKATILNGQIGSIYGAPVIASEFVREDLNASGVYDGITTTKTYALVVNRAEWALGSRMALDIEVDESIYRETFQKVLVAFERLDFQNIGDAATNEDTAIGYGVTP